MHLTKSLAMELTLNVTGKMIENLFICAMEGGANYWANFPKAPAGEGAPSERIIRSVLDGATATISDAETDDQWTLSIDSIRNGLQKMASDHPEHFADLLAGNEDAETADVWLQLCTIGELTFG